MISIQCTKCETELTIDDAFAGGVCRCQHCGTIQTVPADSATAARPVFSEPIHQKKIIPVSPTGQSSGLDDLAQALGGGSSGLTGSGIGSSGQAMQTRQAQKTQTVAVPVATPEAEPAPAKTSPVLPLAFFVALLVFAGIGVGLFFFLHGRTAQSSGPAPSFAGVTINAGSVIYLLDNGSATGTLVDPLKAVCYKSLTTLGPERRFQVLAWDSGPGSAAYPADGMHAAAPEEVAACRQAFGNVAPGGNTHLAGPLKKALEQHPGAIVIATGKWDLDRDDVAALGSASEAGVKIYTFGLGTAPDQGALKLAATGTGGQYRHLSAGELNQASE